MARIKIEDLPKDIQVSEREMRAIFGGALALRTYPLLRQSPVLAGLEWQGGLEEATGFSRRACTHKR